MVIGTDHVAAVFTDQPRDLAITDSRHHVRTGRPGGKSLGRVIRTSWLAET
jgi:hypothetical protein